MHWQYLARRLHSSIMASFSAVMVSACSIYPLPQDYSGSSSNDIVTSIRCEAREALRETAIEYLRSRKYIDAVIWRNYTGGSLANLLEKRPTVWQAIKIRDLRKEVRDDFAFYENSQIAYEFSLGMQESNIDSADFSLVRPFSSGRRDTIGLGASIDRKRNVTRTFNVVDTFAELALEVKDEYCNRPRTLNVIYPIAGKLPIRDLVGSYIHTNEFGNLGGPGKELKSIFGTKSTPAIPQMGDTIVFTTKLAGNVKPGLSFPTAAPEFSLASATFGTTDFRQDEHQVIIVVSTSPEAAAKWPLNATVPPPLPFSGRSVAAQSRFYYLPPSKDGKLSDARAAYALDTLAAQRQRNVDNAIIQIGNSLSQLAP